MITVSVCMIVKNEEAVLKRCLDSLQGIADEIIIADTGSTDSTKEIARQYTDKVYDFAWTGSFSDARNFVFSKAACDYIYSADADEVIDEENRQKFMILKRAMVPEIDIVQMYYSNQLQHSTIYNYDSELRPKLYKRLRTFRFEAPIHEQVVLEPVIFDSDITIIHMPQGEHTSRDLAAFEKIWQQGETMDYRLHGIYARELFISGTDEDFIRAIPYFQNATMDTNASEDTLMETFAVLVHAYHLQKDVERLFNYAMKAVILTPCSEVCYELGLYYKEKGDLKEASIWFYNALNETEAILDARLGGEKAQEMLDQVLDALPKEEE
ncbi:MAG: glycosyltransferase family 2 protein [Lachnospiraceae bacterium]|nr:glycosyltransferase family 2 protein [Lachnospiraceae bacterium]